jgi:hypothetical protein
MTHADTHPPVPAESGRDWWVMAGTTVAAVSAAVASFDGLRGLARLAGWPGELAWLLPVTLDAYAMTSARVWLAGTTRTRAARRFARANAVGAITVSIAGNAAYHAHGAGLLAVSWPIVVLVGAVPAAVLGLTAHLHALRGRTEPEPDPPRRRKSEPNSSPQNGTHKRSGPASGGRRTRRTDRRSRNRSEDELLAAAREAAERYQNAHGRPITRDALRAELRISGARASTLRRQITAPNADTIEVKS